MKPEQLEALLRYRIEQAHDTLREAEILLNAAALHGTINRASCSTLCWPSSLPSSSAHRNTAGPFPSLIVSSQTANAPSPRPRGRHRQLTLQASIHGGVVNRGNHQIARTQVFDYTCAKLYPRP